MSDFNGDKLKLSDSNRDKLSLSDFSQEETVKKNHLLALSIAIAVLLSCVGPARSVSAQSKDSLYKRLGGYDALAAVTPAQSIKHEMSEIFARG